MSASHKFIYTPDIDDYSEAAVTIESRAVVLDDILVAFEAYICAAGFRSCLEGKQLELVDRDKSNLN